MLNPFSKRSVGLDIADRSIEVAELHKSGRGIVLSSLGRVTIPQGVIVRGRIKDEKVLEQIIHDAFDKARPESISPHEVIFGVPESQVYTHVFTAKGKAAAENREKLIVKEVQENIPLKSETITYSYRVREKEKGVIEVLVVATRKEVVREWRDFFNKVKIHVKEFDSEVLANFRGLFPDPPLSPIGIVDIGSNTTAIAMFTSHGLHYVYSIKNAGDKFTREIAKTMNVSIAEAERAKIKYGLENENEQVFPILVKSLEPIMREIKSAVEFTNNKTGEHISEIVLVGGSSQMKGFFDYFASNLEQKVSLGRSVLSTNINASSELKTKKEKKTETPEPPGPLPGQSQRQGSSPYYRFYIEAIGLALRGLDSQWSQKDPSFSIDGDADKKKSVKNSLTKNMRKHNRREPPQDDMLSDENVEDLSSDESKLKKQKIILIVVLIIGIIVVPLAFMFRSKTREAQREAMSQELAQFSLKQRLVVQVPLAVHESEYTNDRIKGRIVVDAVLPGETYPEAVERTRKSVISLLKEGEAVTDSPISRQGIGQISSDPGSAGSDVIQWIVYSEKQANALMLNEVAKRNTKDIDYLLSTIEVEEISESDNSNIFFLNGVVTISLNEFIEIKEETEDLGQAQDKEEEDSGDKTVDDSQDNEEEKGPRVTITNTPTGYLNVRSGPGTGYKIETQIYPQESYPLLEKGEKWYKIDIDNTEGWIFSDFAILLEEAVTEKKPNENKKEEQVIKTPRVTIVNTPTGWLNVRARAGTEFEVITRVFPGTQYHLLSEEGDWYEIEISSDISGWVFSQYANKVE